MSTFMLWSIDFLFDFFTDLLGVCFTDSSDFYLKLLSLDLNVSFIGVIDFTLTLFLLVDF